MSILRCTCDLDTSISKVVLFSLQPLRLKSHLSHDWPATAVYQCRIRFGLDRVVRRIFSRIIILSNTFFLTSFFQYHHLIELTVMITSELENKVMTLREAAELVPNGAHISATSSRKRPRKNSSSPVRRLMTFVWEPILGISSALQPLFLSLRLMPPPL